MHREMLSLLKRNNQSEKETDEDSLQEDIEDAYR